MTHVSDGQLAETAAAEYLVRVGYRITDRNWRTRFCEIDIIATKNSTVYFVEVKYRRTNNQGTGLDYITSKKLKQMHYAAQLWLAKDNWSGDSQLAAIEVSGQSLDVSDLIEIDF